MNWLAILLVYELIILSKDSFKVHRVFFLENDFWSIYQRQLKTDKGYLSRVGINLESKSIFTNGFDCFFKDCYPLKSTNLGYILLEYSMIQDITSFLSSPEIDKFLLRLHFLFTDKPIVSLRYFEKYKGKIREHATYKLPEKNLGNSISLKCNVSTDVRLKYMKGMFKGLIWMKILKFNEYIKTVIEKRMEKGKTNKIEDDAVFNLYYFKNCSECLENFKSFIENLCYLKLIKDDVSDLFTAESYNLSMEETSILKVSQFKERLHKKCYENLKTLFDNQNNEDWKLLLDECFNYFKKKLLKNRIFFPIGGIFNIDYYIEKLYNLIYKLFEEIKRNYTVINSKDKDFIFSEIFYSLKLNVKQTQLSAIQDFFESEYIPKHFSELLGRKVETSDDYIEVEKMVCDYYNMFAYIFNLYYKFNKKSYISYSYAPPVSTDDYNMQIIDGIEIKFNRPANFVQIRGFDNKGDEVKMVKDIDYFISKLVKLYCPSNVLKLKNIHEIEIISSDNEKSNMRFKVNEYLCV